MKLKMQNIMIDSWNFITNKWDILQVKTVQTLLAYFKKTLGSSQTNSLPSRKEGSTLWTGFLSVFYYTSLCRPTKV